MGKVLQEEIVKYYCHLTPQNSFYLPLTPLYTKTIVCTPALLYSRTPPYVYLVFGCAEGRAPAGLT